MQTLTASFFIPTLTNDLLRDARTVSEKDSRPSLNLLPKWLKWNRTKKVKAYCQPQCQPVEELTYHSLMVNGARHYTSKKYAQALSLYRRALAVRPDDAAALSGEAWSLYHLGQDEQAAKDFRALLKFDANDSWAQEGMVLCENTDPYKVASSTAVFA